VSSPRIFTPEYYALMRELERGGWWNAAMRDIAGRLLEGIALPASGVLLDVGCGGGQTMTWFGARHPSWRTVGIDVSRDAVAAANGLRPGQVAQASALELPFPSGSVDGIVAIDVLQHLSLDHGDERALAEMARVLKARGFLFVRTNAQAFPRVADDPAAAFHRYEAAELRAKLQRSGFVVHRMGRLNALLGLAEIPRELRARRADGSRYHGLMAVVRREPRWLFSLKRNWLNFEGRLAARGALLPAGRTLVALCELSERERTA